MTTSNEEIFVIYYIKKDEVIYKAFNEKLMYCGRPPRIFFHKGIFIICNLKVNISLWHKKIASEIENSKMSRIYYVIWISTSENYKIISLILLIFYWYLYNLIYI